MQAVKFTDQNVITGLDPNMYSHNDLWVITVTPPPRKGLNPPVRRFVAELHHKAWDKTKTPCLYGGTRQGGVAADYGNGHDGSVIEGSYEDYKVADRFSTDFKYKMFDDNRC